MSTTQLVIIILIEILCSLLIIHYLINDHDRLEEHNHETYNNPINMD